MIKDNCFITVDIHNCIEKIASKDLRKTLGTKITRIEGLSINPGNFSAMLFIYTRITYAIFSCYCGHALTMLKKLKSVQRHRR